MSITPHAFGVGLFTAFSTFDIPVGVDLVRTSGYAVAGRGDALYAAVASGPAAPWRVQDANGRWFELSDDLITPQMFGAVADGVANDTQPLKDAITFAGGRQVNLPGGKYVVDDQIAVLSTTSVGAFGPGLNLVGDGMVETIIDNRCSNESLFYLNSTVHAPFTAQMGVRVARLTVTRLTSGVNSSAFELVNAYQVQFDQVVIEKQQGSGILLKNGDYVDDGWNSVAFSNLWIDGCVHWGIDATGGYARNEGSFSKFHNVFIQSCGSNEYFTLSNISNATQGEVSVLLAQLPRTFPQKAGHPFREGDRIMLWGVQGMSQINDAIYKVGPDPTATTFKLYSNVLPSSPVGTPATLGSNPLATVALSRVVTVTAPAHGAARGDFVQISGVANPIGGVAIGGSYEIISVLNANSYTIYSNVAATSTATGGGSAVKAAYALAAPIDTTAFGTFVSGMVTGSLPTNPFSTASGQAGVTVSHTGHSGVVNGVASFSGATAVGGLTLNGSYPIIQVINANSYVIEAPTTASSTASGGGAAVSVAYAAGPTRQAEVSYFEPRTGGLRWKGQLLHLLSCGFTLNQNVAQFIPGDAGLATGVLCEQVTWENSYRRHVFCTGIDSFTAIANQFHGAEAYPTWTGVEFNGWRHLIRGVSWDGTAVRSARNRSTQWKLTGANALPATCRVRRTVWQDFDYVGQRRFDGWQFDQVEDDGLLRHVASNPGEFISFGPSTADGGGNKTPLRMRGPNGAQVNGQWPEAASTTGEWIEWQLGPQGLVRRNSTDGLPLTSGNELAKNAIYNVYLYDADGAPFIALANTADAGSDFSIDPLTGYAIRTSDPSMRWVGRVKTDDVIGQAAKFLTTADTNYIAPSRIAGSQLGSSDWFWEEAGKRKLWFKSGALPTSQDGGSYAIAGSFEASATYDPPLLAAGASATTTLSATCALGDYVVAASFSADQAGVVVQGYVSAANQITAVLTNSTSGTINLAEGTLRALYQRR